MVKKTKRKVAYSKLPMQCQLNLQHEGKHFDLRRIFDDLNERYFRGRLRGYNVMWVEGVALAPNQLDFTDTPTSGTELRSTGGVFFHGANAGVVFQW